MNSPKTIQKGPNADILQYPPEDIWDKLNDLDGKLSLGLYKEHGGKEVLADFTRGLLVAATFPFTFESKLIDYITGLSHQVNKFPLEQSELIKIATEYLEKFIEFHKKENTTRFDNKIYPILKSCRNKVWGDADGGNQNGKDTLKDKFERFIDMVNDYKMFFVSVIYSQPDLPTCYAIRHIVIDVWGWEKFEDYLKSIDKSIDVNQSKCISEFIRFFNVFKKAEYKSYVEFVFEVIPKEKITPWGKD